MTRDMNKSLTQEEFDDLVSDPTGEHQRRFNDAIEASLKELEAAELASAFTWRNCCG